MTKTIILSLALCFLTSEAIAQKFSTDASYDVCFTPGQNCTSMLVDEIHKEKQSILVQAYSFTSVPIAKALVAAKQRGVDVKVILDKSQFKAEKYSASKFLDNHGISVWIDSKPAIAHNKIFIFGADAIATGSFNFTKAAQEKNAENLIIIHDTNLNAIYKQNWFKRKEVSILLSNYKEKQNARINKANR